MTINPQLKGNNSTIVLIFKEDTVKTFWSVGKKAFSLGNLLIFRQEVELLAKINGKKKALIHFVNDADSSFPPYMEELFKSEIEFTFFKGGIEEIHYDWPEKHERNLIELYSTLQRIVRLSERSGQKPYLQWSKNTIENANKFLEILDKNKRKIFACHLKRQAGGRKESNADQESWYRFFKFFECDSSIFFILLGADQVAPEILSCANVVSAQKSELSLSVQLVLCEHVNGFIGMASGISCGAIFSAIPYAIFKHPLHHVEEMKQELGKTDRFGFAQSNQRILRQLDNFENLKNAFSQIN